jgi:hypothetical protein
MVRTGTFERGGCLIEQDRRLSQVIARRPPGVTGHQWSTAGRGRLDFVVRDAATGLAAFAVVFGDSVAPDDRGDRMINAVAEAVGLGILRIDSPTLRPQGRRIIEYVLDARAYTDFMTAHVPDSPGFREIVGRLPDGREGFVNDLGALARAAAIDAYAARQLNDPLLRGLRVQWTDGPAEGWGWLDVGDGQVLFERVTVWPRRVSCGVDAAQFAEDLAALAVGERLRTLDGLIPKTEVRQALERLRLRRHQLADPHATDHITL